MAIITVYAVLRATTTEPEDEAGPRLLTTMAIQVGEEVAGELARREQARIFKAELKAQGKTPAKIARMPGADEDHLDRRAMRVLNQRLRQGEATKWTKECAAIGQKLIRLMAAAGSVTITRKKGRGPRPYLLALSHEMAERLKDLRVREEANIPPRRSPMLYPPRRWTYDEEDNASGGYWTFSSPLIREDHHGHTATLKFQKRLGPLTVTPISWLDRAALDILGATRWRINKRVFDVMYEDTMRRPPPKKVPAWAKIQKNPKFKAAIAAESHDLSIVDQLVAAKALQNEEAIYFPYNRDYRGRCYPLPMSGPNPVANNSGRSLLEFADGEPLGVGGLYWLLIHVANCAGKDKIPHAGRVRWVNDSRDNIIASARAPLETEWWRTQDRKPWALLAACFELAAAWQHESGDPTQHISHLPIPLDATCSAIQHFAAMTGDEVVAEWVNMGGAQTVQDIYRVVADDVIQILRASSENKHARLWLPEFEKAGRQFCKQPTFTALYGSKKDGVRKQIREVVNDRNVIPDKAKREALEELDALNYIAGIVFDEREKRLQPRLVAARDWLQDTASKLAQHGIAFEWITPTGSRCRQSVYKEKRVEYESTTMGKLTSLAPDHDAGLDAAEQRLKASANFVHSLDSAHLSLTVIGAFMESGGRIKSFGMVHDSFSTHAANVDTLARVLRQRFRDMYKFDVLGQTFALISAEHPEVKIDDPREVLGRGNLDLDLLLTNPYFFN
jgi:DNA-directed RNA polymerase